MEEIVRAEMSPYAGRVTMEGPSLNLAPKAAQNFALAIHELATNAAKYGALSNARGHVHIAWCEQIERSGPFRFSLARARRTASSASDTQGFRKHNP